VKTSMAPGSKVVTRYLEAAGLLKDLEAVGFDIVGYGCTTCIAAGAPVLLADGTVCPIEKLPISGGREVWAPQSNGALTIARQTMMIVQGVRECVELTMEDGRKLVCTADHEILTENGRWIRADELALGADRVWATVETEASRLAIDRDEAATVTIPATMTLAVVERRPAGMREVYDLEVEGVHSFVAGTIAVHNCIGNSGPLSEPIAAGITSGNLVAAAVLSGNRNFEGRINPHTRANYLASPPLVVAYALAGTVDIDLEREPLGTGSDGQPVFLRELWPSQKEITETMASALQPAQFREEYGNVFDGNPRWNEIPVAGGELYQWDPESTYIHNPPFFDDLSATPTPVQDVTAARVLVMVGDSVTTDHISPAGDIALDSPAGRWLRERKVEKKDFNSYGSRRGNDLIMVRGTFANIRLKNLLVPGSEGNLTIHFPSGSQVSIFDAAERYRADGTPLMVLAGKEYGSGSSRDWAAKGTLLLGVRAVLAESYERIHRSNLVGMGVLPLQYENGQTAESLGLTGRETFDIGGLAAGLAPGQKVNVRARREDGSTIGFTAIARLDTPVDVDYYKNGGILQTVLRSLAKS